jgi:hypothetical protein
LLLLKGGNRSNFHKVLGISYVVEDLLASLAGFSSMDLEVPAHDKTAHGEVEEYLHSLFTFEKDANM